MPRPTQRAACAADKQARIASLSAIPRRCIIRSATTTNLSSAKSSHREDSPHAKGATTVGGIAVPKQFAPAPITLPVLSRVPIPVFT